MISFAAWQVTHTPHCFFYHASLPLNTSTMASMSPKLCVVVGRINTYFVLYTIVGKRGIVNLSHFAGFSLKYSFLLDKLNYNTLKI